MAFDSLGRRTPSCAVVGQSLRVIPSDSSSLSAVTETLRAAGCAFADEEAQLMITEAKTQLDLTRMIEARTEGIPLEQILGWAEFCGHRVIIETGVFAPRFKTEFLVEQAMALCTLDSVVLDLCCGSGAIGLAVISDKPSIQLLAADIDPIAVACAKQNLAPFGVAVFEGDLFESIPHDLKGRVDILIANAPYVPTDAIEIMPRESRLYESRASLDGGKDGLDVHRRIAAEATVWLAPGGHLLIETGKSQAPNAANIFTHVGLNSKIAYSEEFDATVVIGMKAV